ncbi:Minf_1886 family protein [Gemmata sp.]|uniref:Minf_1886 family protein n=1 Tax=Gemmata sp. TaxID=1914242 RepID=UPI003F7171FA
MDPRLLELCRQAPHFAYEAYDFVCDAVTFTQERLGRAAVEDRDGADDRHVTGGELLQGVCDLAVTTFGMMAPVVFRLWNVRTTDDVGRMVFDLIRVGRLSKSDRDAPEDFHDLFDLPQALADGFELTLDDRAPAKRGER